jgi:hypothetical protein
MRALRLAAHVLLSADRREALYGKLLSHLKFHKVTQTAQEFAGGVCVDWRFSRGER